ncbi:MAG: transposase [Chthoniobacteraceae bacterium]
MNETNPSKEVTTAKRERRHYDAEFKKAAVEHCARHGGDLSHTAGELGINYWTLRDWVEAVRTSATRPATPRTVGELEAENRRLRSELARVTEQREILKKSLGILSTP